MNATELHEVFRELPAGPFTVHVAERTPVEVRHSDFAAISPTGGLLTVWDAEGHLHHLGSGAITRITHGAPADQLPA
jgi:hypothetical protein